MDNLRYRRPTPEPDVARTIGEALGLTEKDYLSHWCRPGGQTASVHHNACMGNYGGNVCRCLCHDSGSDTRDFSALPEQDPYRTEPEE